VPEAAPAVRVVAPQPQQRGRHETGRDRVRRKAAQALSSQFRPDRLHLGGAARVRPDYGIAEGLQAVIEHYGAVHLAGEADRRYVAAGRADVVEHLAHRLTGCLPPGLGPLFGPPRLWLAVQHRPVLVDCHNLGTARPCVDADKNCHVSVVIPRCRRPRPR